MEPTCSTFDVTGNYLIVGFQNGQVRFLNTSTLEDVLHFSPTTCKINNITFSQSGVYFACSDEENRVILFKKSESSNSDALSYTFIGRSVSHFGKIVGIQFGEREGNEVLVSVGVDRYYILLIILYFTCFLS